MSVGLLLSTLIDERVSAQRPVKGGIHIRVPGFQTLPVSRLLLPIPLLARPVPAGVSWYPLFLVGVTVDALQQRPVHIPWLFIFKRWKPAPPVRGMTKNPMTGSTLELCPLYFNRGAVG